MRQNIIFSAFALFLILNSCNKIDDAFEADSIANSESYLKSSNFDVKFEHTSTINVGGEGASEISAYDEKSKKLFIVNVESKEISVYNISDITNPIKETSIVLSSGAPNSVAVSKGKLAVAVEADVKQNPGHILVYDTESLALLSSYEVGALPDMVTFSPNGQYIVSANEGEPNDDYTDDPEGTISIIEVANGNVVTLNFDDFIGSENSLKANGFRVFGPNATLSQDVEPEYVAISSNSVYAWVTLQENNGIAKVNLETKQIEAIYPLGFKDYNHPENAMDLSDKDGKKELNNWPVYGIYQPDAIEYLKVNGIEYVITANEGDSRDYSGFSEEVRVGDLVLDETAFPLSFDYLNKTKLGRLKTTTTLGDTDGDGDYDEIYSYGARSFTIWTGNGQMVYDSGNEISRKTLELTPERFNNNDDRSDDKGAEPESVEILTLKGNKHILFVGLERNNQILVYDISNPVSPVFLDILSSPADQGPEGLLAVPAQNSPSGKDLLIVSNEVSGTVSIYQNNY